MSTEECLTADWRAIGYEDGAQGQNPDYFGERRKACAEHGITADFDAYLVGRAEGLALFCRPPNGYRLGVRDYNYSGVCPVELEDAFLGPMPMATASTSGTPLSRASENGSVAASGGQTRSNIFWSKRPRSWSHRMSK